MMRVSLVLFLVWLPLAPVAEAVTVSKTVRVSFEIVPVTVMKVSSETGVSAVRMGPIAPRAAVPTRTLQVSVVTNAGQRYRVYHHLDGAMTNASGEEFPLAKLQVMVSQGTEGGRSEVPSFRSVPSEEVLIFTSDPGGGPDTFQITYSIENTELFSAGLYYGNLYLDIRIE